MAQSVEGLEQHPESRQEYAINPRPVCAVLGGRGDGCWRAAKARTHQLAPQRRVRGRLDQALALIDEGTVWKREVDPSSAPECETRRR
jgi:hypothetical protein